MKNFKVNKLVAAIKNVKSASMAINNDYVSLVVSDNETTLRVECQLTNVTANCTTRFIKPEYFKLMTQDSIVVTTDTTTVIDGITTVVVDGYHAPRLIDDLTTILKLERKEFIRQLTILIAHAGNNDVRYYLNGFLIKIENGYCNFVASDGHRLVFTEKFEVANVDDVAVIVSRDCAETLLKVLKATDDTTIEVAINDCDTKMIQFTGDSWSIESVLIDAKYPDFGKIMYQPFGITETDFAKLKIDATKAKLVAKLEKNKFPHVEVGDGVNFNASYLLDMLKFEPEMLEIAHNLSTMRVTTKNKDILILMPMRV